jgi:NAD+ kinase
MPDLAAPAEITKVGIYHHPELDAARDFAGEIRDRVAASGRSVWVSSAWDPVASTRDLPATDLLIAIGGDGTILRAARAVVPHPIAILGVDMGRLAFLTEFEPDDLRAHLDDVLAGKFSIDERTMLDIDFEGFGASAPQGTVSALNDVTVGRTSLGRPVYVNVRLNGDLIGVLRGDGVVIATATGSTGYSLSAGGPILDPTSRFLVLTPVAPHLAAAVPLVLPPDSEIELSVGGPSEVAVSVDGQGAQPVDEQGRVLVRRSEHVARMVRYREKPFFAQLGRRLAWLDERRLKAVSLPDEAPPSG